MKLQHFYLIDVVEGTTVEAFLFMKQRFKSLKIIRDKSAISRNLILKSEKYCMNIFTITQMQD